MKNKIKTFLLKVLPDLLVKQVRRFRKNERINKRFKINNGENIKYTVDSLNNKFNILLNPYLNGGVDEDIYKTGEWEPEIGSLILKFLRKGDCFLDIGANIGYHSLFAANLVGEFGKIVAFEPIPRIYNQLLESVKLNNFSNVKVFNKALSNRIDKAYLSLIDENIGASSLKEVDEQREVGSKILIDLDMLDNFQNELGGVKLIKIDVEGNEYEVIKGGMELLQKFRPVIVLEFSAHLYECDYVGKSLDLYNTLISLGYKITNIAGEEMNVSELIKNKEYEILHTNLLCVPHTSAELRT